LWKTAQEEVAILCLLPEQLISKGFADLLVHKPFADRFCSLGVDEIHLLYSWGQLLQVSLQQIGHVRARCPDHVVMCAVSATVADGKVMDTICDFLGYLPGQFHLIRRSNARPDVQLLVRELQTALGGWLFLSLTGYWTKNKNHSSSVQPLHSSFALLLICGVRPFTVARILPN
jgi:superfamily II DNA helicase RecQ